MITRRQLATGATAALLLSGFRPARAGTASAALQRDFASIETKSGGRLGVAMLDTGSGLTANLRGDERFPMCSTFKLLAAAAILARVDAGEETLDRRIAITRDDIVEYAPETEKHVGGTLSLAAICKAAITLSDNTAGNLMLAALGGPQAVTVYARSLGDTVTRLDRTEPTLNTVAPDDPRDTTTPVAMLGDLRALLVGDALSESSRDQLTAWLIASKTGGARLRAGLPQDWRAGDKTGSCNAGTANDVAIVWPPGKTPILIAAYLTSAKTDRDAQNAALAAVARTVASAVAG